MRNVLIIGAGLSGCTAASNLADSGISVILVEKMPDVGGKVRLYGCKATADKCNGCGVCLTADLWNKVSRNPNIRIMTNSIVKDVAGTPGNFKTAVETTTSLNATPVIRYFDKLDAVIVSTGFESQTSGISSHLHIEKTQEGALGLVTGTQLEEMLLGRTRSKLFETTPNSVAFIQCFGSRDEKESGLYCSRVCCAYSTRAAKVLRSYYPECEIVFFYMELQNVKNGNYYAELRELGMEFIKCRPLKITGGLPAEVEYDDPVGGITQRKFDMIVLSEGIHAAKDNEQLSQICKIGLDEFGFLRTAGTDCGIYVSGCAKKPLKIEEAFADSVAVAGEVLNATRADNQSRSV